jgi:hypothetical protein
MKIAPPGKRVHKHLAFFKLSHFDHNQRMPGFETRRRIASVFSPIPDPKESQFRGWGCRIEGQVGGR